MQDNSPAPFKNVEEPSPMKIDRQKSLSVQEEETKSESKKNEGTETADDEDTL